MPRFIHAADLHLDSPLRGLARYEGAPAEAVRESSRRALENLVGLAVERRPDFVLLAGDLYDGDWKDYNTGLYFAGQMSRLGAAGVPVLLIHGNHDAASHMTRSLRLPDNVFIFPTDAPYTRYLNQCGTVVHGQSYAHRQVTENLGAGYPAPAPGFFNIGLLHTSLETPGADKRYAPCSPGDLMAKGYDYWALGHRHNLQVFSEAPPILFCGAAQGRDITEHGPHGCVWVEAEAGKITWERIALDVLRWAVLDVDATGAVSMDEVLERTARVLDQAVEAAEGRTLAARVRIQGACPAHDQLARSPDVLANQVRGVAIQTPRGRAWVEKVLLETAPATSLEDMARSSRPIGDLLLYLDELALHPEMLVEMARGDKDLEALARGPLAEADGLCLNDPCDLTRLLPKVRNLLLSRLQATEDET